MCEEMAPRTHIVRHAETGLYWRGTKNMSRHKPRSPWTDKPERAWLCHLEPKQVRRLFEGHFRKGEVPPYYVCLVELHVGMPAWDRHHDKHAECMCGHEYYRHFDTYEDMAPVGCKYCPCGPFEPQDYPAEFKAAQAEGWPLCGRPNEERTHACCRPKNHYGQHVALDDEGKVTATWEWWGDMEDE